MAYVEIDMPEFNKYIKLVNNIVNDVCMANKIYSNKVLRLEHCWTDSNYSKARKRLAEIQTATNEFISTLDGFGQRLISWYCTLYEAYVSTPYEHPVLKMDDVEIIEEYTVKFSELSLLSFAPEREQLLDGYIQSTTAYIALIRDLLSEFFICHRKFAEYFHSRRYEEITDALQEPYKKIDSLLNELDNFAAKLKK